MDQTSATSCLLLQLEERLVAAADRVADRMRARAERKVKRTIDPNDPDADIKLEQRLRRHQLRYALDARRLVQRCYAYLPYFVGLTKVFEIGVGAGYMLALLRQHLGIPAHGLDLPAEQRPVFDAMVRELGLRDFVIESAVEAGQPIPIPKGSDCVAAFQTQFNRTWGVDEHEWFLGECGAKLTGARLVMIHFNRGGFQDSPEVMELYRRRGVSPFIGHDKFHIVSL